MSIVKRTALAVAAATAAGLAFVSWNAASAAPSGGGPAASAPSLSTSERSGLVFTREEERLAHDLYTLFADKYDAVTFTRIAAGEQRHFDAVGVLLTRYGISDPSAGAKAGTYADTTLQNLYDTWKAKGLKSVAEAYQVGVALEKRDIADLHRLQKEATNTDLARLYTNLENASEHHLAAFTAAANGTPLPMGSGNGSGVGQPYRGGNGKRDGSCRTS